jgi:hypothetical protein
MNLTKPQFNFYEFQNLQIQPKTGFQYNSWSAELSRPLTRDQLEVHSFENTNCQGKFICSNCKDVGILASAIYSSNMRNFLQCLTQVARRLQTVMF